MKNAKKVLAMVIVLALAISMAIPASAGSITVDQAAPFADPAEYKAWKMADLTWVAVEDTAGAYSYTADTAWVKFFKEVADDYFDYNELNGVVTLKNNVDVANDSDTMKAIAKLAYDYAIDETIEAKEAISTKVDGRAVFDGTTKGYYLVYSPLGSALMVNTAGDGNDSDDNMVITEKNEKPVLRKTVKDIDVVDYAYSVDVAIGDTVTYKLEIDAKPGALNYVVKDTLTAGITYNGDVSVSVEGVTGVTVDDSDSNGQNLVFELDKEELAIGKTIVITYTADVTAGVQIETANTNTAVLFYGEDKNDDGIGDNEANRDTASVYTWAFNFAKIANNVFADKLTTATFKVLLNGTPLKFSKDGNTYRLLANQAATGAGVYEEISTTDGTYRVEGLDGSLTYTLDEIQVPDGYNAIPDGENITVSIDAAGEVTATSNITQGYVEVNNNSGVELPSTGGTGTVIFVTVGSILVLAMGVLLVVRKRMSKVVYTR